MRDINVISGKYAFKTAKGHQLKKKGGVRGNREFGQREVQNLEEPIMLRWPYLWNPSLQHVDFWIYWFYHTPLLTDRRDLKAHTPFDRNHHRKFPGKQKEIHLQGSFGRWPMSLSSTVGSYLFLDMWCTQLLPSFWTVEIRNARSGKVSFMLNSSSSIFRLVRFYSTLWRSNHWIILIVIYIVHNSMIYILTVGIKQIIRGA